MGNAWKDMLGRKKFQAALGTIAFMVLNEPLGLHVSEGNVQMIIGLAVAFIVGQGLADFGKERKTTP